MNFISHKFEKTFIGDPKEIYQSDLFSDRNTPVCFVSHDCLISRGKKPAINLWKYLTAVKFWSKKHRCRRRRSKIHAPHVYMCFASNTDWHLTTHEFVVSSGKDSASVCATSLALRRDAEKFPSGSKLPGTPGNASWLPPNSRRNLLSTVSPTWKRDAKRRLTEPTPLPDKVARNFREKSRENYIPLMSRTIVAMILLGSRHFMKYF